MNDAIKDRISKSRVFNKFVPVIYRKLTRDQGGPQAVPIIDERQQISALFGSDLTHSPIIEEDEIGFENGCKKLFVSAISSGDREILKESGGFGYGSYLSEDAEGDLLDGLEGLVVKDRLLCACQFEVMGDIAFGFIGTETWHVVAHGDALVEGFFGGAGRPMPLALGEWDCQGRHPGESWGQCEAPREWIPASARMTCEGVRAGQRA